MIKRLFAIIELWLWTHNFITIGGMSYFPIGGGSSSSKAKKAEQTAAEQRQEAEIKAGEETKKASLEAERKLIEAGQRSREQMLAAGAPTTEETERRERYRAKALTPGETLMTQAGPISQAVARRIQERIETPYEFKRGESELMPLARERTRERLETPGLDYLTESAAFTEGVSAPIWRALKARGIVPPPGTEGGGGLATQQYMKGAVPALAELRTRQISEDITRGTEFAKYEDLITQYEDAIRRGDIEAAQGYAAEARQLQQIYEEAEGMLAEAIRGRQYEVGIRGAEAEQLGTREGAPYEVTGAQAAGAGQTAAAAINQAEVQARYARSREEKAQIGKMAAMIVLGAISGGAGATMLPAAWGISAGAGAVAGAAGGGMAALGGGGGGTDITTQLALINALRGSTPPAKPTPPTAEVPSALQRRIYARTV